MFSVVLALFYRANLFFFLFPQDYCASKFGAIGFHESLSHELKASEKDGINMTLVCPYLVDTGMFKGCRIRLVSFLVLTVSYTCLEFVVSSSQHKIAQQIHFKLQSSS